jgi:hypothetical protein
MNIIKNNIVEHITYILAHNNILFYPWKIIIANSSCKLSIVSVLDNGVHLFDDTTSDIVGISSFASTYDSLAFCREFIICYFILQNSSQPHSFWPLSGYKV